MSYNINLNNTIPMSINSNNLVPMNNHRNNTGPLNSSRLTIEDRVTELHDEVVQLRDQVLEMKDLLIRMDNRFTGVAATGGINELMEGGATVDSGLTTQVITRKMAQEGTTNKKASASDMLGKMLELMWPIDYPSRGSMPPTYITQKRSEIAIEAKAVHQYLALMYPRATYKTLPQEARLSAIRSIEKLVMDRRQIDLTRCVDSWSTKLLLRECFRSKDQAKKRRSKNQAALIDDAPHDFLIIDILPSLPSASFPLTSSASVLSSDPKPKQRSGTARKNKQQGKPAKKANNKNGGNNASTATAGTGRKRNTRSSNKNGADNDQGNSRANKRRAIN